MVKHFCDNCKKEITGKSINVVDVGNMERIEYIEICNTCKKKEAIRNLEFVKEEISVCLNENEDSIPDDIYIKIFEITRVVLSKYLERNGVKLS